MIGEARSESGLIPHLPAAFGPPVQLQCAHVTASLALSGDYDCTGPELRIKYPGRVPR